MRIYVTHATSFNFKHELYAAIKESKLWTEHTVLLPHDDSSQLYTTLKMFKQHQFDLILAEVSYPSTGQGIELGWANSYNIPILAIYRQDTKPSRAIQSVTQRIETYQNLREYLNSLTF